MTHETIQRNIVLQNIQLHNYKKVDVGKGIGSWGKNAFLTMKYACWPIDKIYDLLTKLPLGIKYF
jgi:hypothetical protein